MQNKKIKIINYTRGGIGNQLFQHVFGRSIAKRMNAEFYTDINYYSSDPYGFNACIWDLMENPKKINVREIVGDGTFILKEGEIQSLNQTNKLPAEIINLILYGYWQNEALLDKDIVRETYRYIQKRFSKSINNYEEIKNSKNINSVALHIRRRDYGHMGICKNSYYVEGIKYFLEKYEGIKFYVFSDEPNYTRHLLNSIGIKYTLISSGNDLQDLYLMSLCKHFIISNSSFSWWGAYFEEERKGEIIYPFEWTTIDLTPSPCPERWKAIRNSINSFALI